MADTFTKEVTVFDYNDIYAGFFVEVSNEGNSVEFYLAHKDYDPKSHMFRIPAHHDSAEYPSFIDANIEEHVNMFIEEYFD